MANTSSAIKKIRVDQRRKAQNDVTRKGYKLAVKTVRDAIKSGNTKVAIEAMPTAYKALDKAARKNVIHQNKASRLKSRLEKAVSSKK